MQRGRERSSLFSHIRVHTIRRERGTRECGYIHLENERGGDGGNECERET